MTMAEVIAFVSGFAAASGAPVRTQTTVTSVTRVDEGYHVATDRGDFRCRCLVLASGACNVASVPAVRQAVPASVECFTALEYRNPGSASRRRRPRRRRVGHRRAAGRRNPALRPAGDAVGRRARAAAANLSRQGRPVVDGSLRHLEPALRRDRRPDAREEAAVAAAGRHARARNAQPQLAQRRRRADRRPPGRRARRARAVFGRAPQSVRAGRSEDGQAPRRVRRVGAQPYARRGRGAERALRADAPAGFIAAGSSAGDRRDPVDHLGHGISPGLQLAARACCGPEGAPAPRWRRRRCAGAVRDWAARSPAPQVHLHPRRGGRRAGSDRAPRRLSGECHRRSGLQAHDFWQAEQACRLHASWSSGTRRP